MIMAGKSTKSLV